LNIMLRSVKYPAVSGNCGVNIMKGFNILFFIIIVSISLSCGDQKTGSDKSGDQNLSSAENTAPPIDRSAMTEEEKITADLIEMIERLAEGDKSVLYENEFNYYQDEVSFTEYWKIYKVYYYQYDTLRTIEVDSVMILGDSAHVYAKLIYESKAGGRAEDAYNFWTYKLTGEKWIKPYISVLGANREIEYLEEIRRYEEEAGN